jgi:hypothetical protein
MPGRQTPAHAGQQPWLIERDQLQERFSVGMRRQEIDLGIDGKVAQFGRLTTRLRCQLRCVIACSRPKRIASCRSGDSGLPSGSSTIKVSIAMPSRVVKICAS